MLARSTMPGHAAALQLPAAGGVQFAYALSATSAGRTAIGMPSARKKLPIYASATASDISFSSYGTPFQRFKRTEFVRVRALRARPVSAKRLKARWLSK